MTSLFVGLALFALFSLFLQKRAGRTPAQQQEDLRQLLERFAENPVLRPDPDHWWESEAVLNPAAVYAGGRVHLFYRAMGKDGMSRLGYAWSTDGIHFERLPYPVFEHENVARARSHYPNTSPARLTYDTINNESGGGWGGCEDPRGVVIDDRVYLTFNMFNGWDSMRVAYTSIAVDDLLAQRWAWDKSAYLCRDNRQKNWVLFPEKINGKFALFYNLDKGDPTRVHIAYLDNLDMKETPGPDEALDPHKLPDHVVAWHHRTRSAATPPVKTKYGWLLFYHAMDKDDPDRYKLGVMLLDLADPTKVLLRASKPILEPDAWYENDWKPGIIYATGAVAVDDDLFIYYGGGDKYIAAVKTSLPAFLNALKTHQQPSVSLFINK